jgi:choline dehydrogenase-like flavoprotein
VPALFHGRTKAACASPAGFPQPPISSGHARDRQLLVLANYGQYYFEMAPNSESRVMLADTLDPVFGQQQTHINWALGQLDEDTYNQTTALFKTAVNNLGGDSFWPWDSVKPYLVVNGHHIGTTRMSSDPAQGVVDANLKVHTLGITKLVDGWLPTPPRP